jgi:hypothetical protein
VTVQDTNGCVASTSITVTQPTALSLTLAGRNPCFGTTNGSVVATFSGGTGTLTSQVDGGGFTSGSSPRTFSNLGPGLHTVDVKDANGCTKTATVTLTENPQILVSLTETDATCPTGNTGAITATFSGGTGTLQSSIDGGTFTTVASPRTFTGLSTGSHTVTIRDANPNNLCTASATITINAPPAPTFSLTGTTNPSCNGVNDGTITATFAGANGPYQIRIDSGTYTTQTSPYTFTGLSAGSHTVQLRDASLCTFSQSATLTAPPAIQILIGKSDATCFNSADGSVVASFSGGTGTLSSALDGAPYTIAGNSRTWSGLLPGIHTVSIRDGTGCIATSSITVDSPPAITLSLGETDATCVGGSDGKVTATYSGGVASLTTIFSQSFDGTSPPLTNFTSATPNSGQWDAISGSTPANITTSSNYLQVVRNATGTTYLWARTTDFSPTPTAMIMKFDYTLQSATATGNLSEVVRVGSSFTTAIPTADSAKAQTYSRFYINHASTAPSFTISDAFGNLVSPSYSGTQTITWVLNNTGSTLTYTDPIGEFSTVPNDNMDIWVGQDLVLDDGPVLTATQSMTDMKWVWAAATGTVRFDNFLIQSPNGPLYSNIDGGPFALVASPRTFTGLLPGSHSVIVKDLQDCQISQSISVGTTPIPYTIAASAGAGGAITPAGNTTVLCGTDQAYTIAANNCFSIADVTVDGVSQGAIASYTFTNVQANHTIAATFGGGNTSIVATAGTGGTITPSGTVSPGCGSDQAFTITPDGCDTIADVVVDGVSIGAVSTYTFTGVQAGHTITASFTLKPPSTITATAGSNGSIAPSGDTQVTCGYSQVYQITPSNCFVVADVTVDGVSVGAMTSYTFTNVTAAHTIDASFAPASGLTLTASVTGSGGAITPSGTVPVGCGGDQSFAVAADPCYLIADVKVDGTSMGALSSYTFTNVQASHTIDATFAITTYTVAASAGTGGAIAPSGDVTVNCGSDQAFAVAANACYSIADVAVDGSSVGAVSGYTFTNVQAAHTIAATFAVVTYTIDASAAPAGGITPSGAVVANCGSDAAFTIAPNPCYSIADVAVDGGSVGAVGGYTFTNVQANHTIAATFSLDGYTIAASAGAGGQIAPAGSVPVGCGADQAFDVTAGSLLLDRGRRRRRQLRRPGRALHVRERAGKPHDRGVVRHHHVRHRRLGGRGRLDRAERDRWRQPAAATRRSR